MRSTQLLFVCLVCWLTSAVNAAEPTPDQKKRIEELKKQIADKKGELEKLEAELMKLTPIAPSLKALEYLAGGKPVIQGPLSYEITATRSDKQPDGNSRLIIQIKIKNVSEKENAPHTLITGKITKASLTDDTGREYRILTTFAAKIKSEGALPPGNSASHTFTIPGSPTAGAKEICLLLPQVGDVAPIRMMIPVSQIKPVK